MKKKIKWIVLAVIVLGVIGAAMGGNDGSVSKTKNDESIKTEKKEEKKEEEKIYGIGETVTYSKKDNDILKFVVNSVKVTEERNQFNDSNPAQVIVINYTYENIADEDDVFISSVNFKVIDEGGNVCETYPAGINEYPQAAPIGAKSTGEEAYGLKQQSSKIKLIVEFDFLGDTKATFELPIQ